LWCLGQDGEIFERIEPQPFHRLNHVGEKELLAQYAESLQAGQTKSPGREESKQGGHVPRLIWHKIHASAVDDEEGAVWLREAARLCCRDGGFRSLDKAADALRMDADGNGFTLEKSGQNEFLVLAEQPQAQEN